MLELLKLGDEMSQISYWKLLYDNSDNKEIARGCITELMAREARRIYENEYLNLHIPKQHFACLYLCKITGRKNLLTEINEDEFQAAINIIIKFIS